MRKIYLCPGKININKTDQCWYKPVNTDKYYCGTCLEDYSDVMEPQFNLEVGTKHYCGWNRNFTDCSLTVSNVKISIVDPLTLYRYTVKKITGTYIKVKLPDKANYMIVIENCVIGNDMRINVENIKHGDTDNTYYNKFKDQQIIKFMSYTSELIYDETDYDKNIITMQINKLIRQPSSQFYKLLDKPFDVQIELITDNYEINKMNNLIEKYKKNSSDTKKIIIIDDCI